MASSTKCTKQQNGRAQNRELASQDNDLEIPRVFSNRLSLQEPVNNSLYSSLLNSYDQEKVYGFLKFDPNNKRELCSEEKTNF